MRLLPLLLLCSLTSAVPLVTEPCQNGPVPPPPEYVLGVCIDDPFTSLQCPEYQQRRDELAEDYRKNGVIDVTETITYPGLVPQIKHLPMHANTWDRIGDSKCGLLSGVKQALLNVEGWTICEKSDTTCIEQISSDPKLRPDCDVNGFSSITCENYFNSLNTLMSYGQGNVANVPLGSKPFDELMRDAQEAPSWHTTRVELRTAGIPGFEDSFGDDPIVPKPSTVESRDDDPCHQEPPTGNAKAACEIEPFSAPACPGFVEKRDRLVWAYQQNGLFTSPDLLDMIAEARDHKLAWEYENGRCNTPAGIRQVLREAEGYLGCETWCIPNPSTAGKKAPDCESEPWSSITCEFYADQVIKMVREYQDLDIEALRASYVEAAKYPTFNRTVVELKTRGIDADTLKDLEAKKAGA